MNILFLNSLGRKKWGGGEKWMLMAASGLRERGHKVIVGCADKSKISQNARSLNLPTLPLSFKTDFDFWGFFRLLGVLKKNPVDVIICGQNKDTKIASVAARVSGGQAVLARHGLQLISRKLKYKYIFTKMIDGIITNTRSIKEEYDSYCWFRPGFVKVIYNGFNPPADVDPFDFRANFCLPEDALVFFSAGRLASQKGFDVLIKAAAKGVAEGHNWYFFIAGKGKKEKELRRQVRAEGLDDRFHFIGFVDKVLPYVLGADVFVMPSFYEGMPNAVMEAMGVGKCCVATAVNGSTELIEDGVDGILVEARNPESLYVGLLRAGSDQAFREELGSAAREKVRTNFSEKAMLDNLEDYLVEITKASAQRIKTR